MSLFHVDHPSPVGTLSLFADEHTLVGVYFPEHAPALEARDGAGHPVLDRARAQLDAYFAGERTSFDLPLAPPGTAFQRAVWDALRAIPFGHTRSYGQLAAAVGRPKASRAVGAANGQNPIAIVIPCHRVIGADGSLTGYGGGMPRKEWLLRHERVFPMLA
jgi:methylated-DNA-[protein]-cysteine S-methyltransferase